MNKKLEVGMWVKVKEDDYLSTSYKILEVNSDSVKLQILPPKKTKEGYNLQVPIGRIVHEE